MSEVETITYPIERLQEFCSRVFMHFGVPADDATCVRMLREASALRPASPP